jgi:hypothetical protein
LGKWETEEEGGRRGVGGGGGRRVRGSPLMTSTLMTIF